MDSISLRHLCCRTDPGSSQVYGGEAHGGKYVAVSKLNQATGRYYAYHKLPGSQTSSRTCPKTPSIAAFRNNNIVKFLPNCPLQKQEEKNLGKARYQVLRRKSFFSNHSFHCLDILPNCIICIQLKVQQLVREMTSSRENSRIYYNQYPNKPD